jgi:plastocyanin
MRRHARLLIASVPLLVVVGLAAAGVATAGGGCHAATEPIASEGNSATVKIDGCTFAPTITHVAVGTEVRFINASGVPHDVTGRKSAWASDTLDDGATYKHRFIEPGLYPYSCSLHPGMAGVVVVGSPDLSLANDVQAAPVAPVAADVRAGDAMLPILAAGGLGILAGALVAGAVVSRRQRAD